MQRPIESDFEYKNAELDFVPSLKTLPESKGPSPCISQSWMAACLFTMGMPRSTQLVTVVVVQCELELKQKGCT